jgi:4-hydroxybenzoate polyprenyltransferase
VAPTASSAAASRPLVERVSTATWLAAACISLRPRQWTKNFLVFAGIIFAAKFDDAGRWLAVGAVFSAYCAASSAAYLLNDIRDVERDRAHPTKSARPIARGTISIPIAAVMSVALMAAAIAAASIAGRDSLLLLLLFLVVQASYSVRLKHVVLVDVLTIAGLFVVRGTAGAAAAHVRISPWLLLCSGLLALFLALSKRRAELTANPDASAARPALKDYSLPLLDQLVLIATTSTITSYALYTFTARDSKALMVTIPFVIFGLFRYLLLADRDGLGEEPENVFLMDKPLLVCIGTWVAVAAVALTLA